jgi:UDP-N-acetylmuramoyl-L-alanyl-D-glutamate--2,6-diaminopimelate ligase
MIAVTGTNGKTTVTHLLASILRADARSVETIGTLSGALTTPEAPDLQRRLAGFVRDGADAVVMEVSSHALVYERVAGTRFDLSIFTNLGRDHRDLHESMEAYFRAKASLFEPELSVRGVTNIDDPYGQLLHDAGQIPMVGFSRDDARDIVVDVSSHRFTWRGQPISVPFGGHFNVMNSLAALVAADLVDVAPVVAAEGLASCSSVPGRFETVSDPDRDGMAVVVDYAHTPDGLDEVLRSARSTVGAGRVIAVFGCAGDRDTEKRPTMGAVGASLADVAVITSDNPRSEDPEAIVQDVVAGVAEDDRSKAHVEVDRKAAIAYAIQAAEPGDIVVIAGKGHEATQTIGDQIIEFDDRVVARRLLEDPSADMSGDNS